MIVWSMNSLNFELGLAPHKYMPPPSPAPIGFAVHIEGAVPLGYSYLFRKISTNVQFNGWGAVQMGHDVGFLRPHYNIIPPAPPNALLLVIIPFSSAKVTFGQMTVFVNDKPAGSWFPVLMNLLYCADPVKLPMGFLVDAAFRNTVIFAFHLVDFLVGLAYTAFEIVSSYLLGKLCENAGGKWLADQLGQTLGNLLGQQLLGRLGIELNEVAVEKLVQRAWSTLWQKTVLKWLITNPIGDGIKHLGQVDVRNELLPNGASSPHDNIVNSAPAINDPPDAGSGGSGGPADSPGSGSSSGGGGNSSGGGGGGSGSEAGPGDAGTDNPSGGTP